MILSTYEKPFLFVQNLIHIYSIKRFKNYDLVQFVVLISYIHVYIYYYLLYTLSYSMPYSRKIYLFNLYCFLRKLFPIKY